jgi:hypothetical protein
MIGAGAYEPMGRLLAMMRVVDSPSQWKGREIVDERENSILTRQFEPANLDWLAKGPRGISTAGDDMCLWKTRDEYRG